MQENKLENRKVENKKHIWNMYYHFAFTYLYLTELSSKVWHFNLQKKSNPAKHKWTIANGKSPFAKLGLPNSKITTSEFWICPYMESVN